MRAFGFLAGFLALVFLVAGCTNTEQKGAKGKNDPGSTKTPNGPAKTEKPSQGS